MRKKYSSNRELLLAFAAILARALLLVALLYVRLSIPYT